jgi:hypothetical protein
VKDTVGVLLPFWEFLGHLERGYPFDHPRLNVSAWTKKWVKLLPAELPKWITGPRVTHFRTQI